MTADARCSIENGEAGAAIFSMYHLLLLRKAFVFLLFDACA
jgi:hypothetical protein